MRTKSKKRVYMAVSCMSVLAVLLMWYLLVDVMEITKSSVFPGLVKTFDTFLSKLVETKPDGANAYPAYERSLSLEGEA